MTQQKRKIAKEDIHIWDGSSETFSAESATGRPQQLNSVDWVGVDVEGRYGSRTGGALSAAAGRVGTTNGARLFLSPGTWTISADLDLSSYTNIRLVCPPGVTISVTSGVTLTLPKAIEAGTYQVFSSAYKGTILFTEGTVVKLEWYGNASTALQAAVNTLLDGGTIEITDPISVATTITAPTIGNSSDDSNQTLWFKGMTYKVPVTFLAADGTDMFSFVPTDPSPPNSWRANYRMTNLMLIGPDGLNRATANSGHGVFVDGTDRGDIAVLTMDHCFLIGFAGTDKAGICLTSTNDCRFNYVQVDQGYNGIYIYGASNQSTWTGVTVFNMNRNGLKIDGCQGNAFYGCWFDNCEYEGVYLDDAVNASFDNLWMEMNNISESGVGNIYILGSSAVPHQITFNNCILSSASEIRGKVVIESTGSFIPYGIEFNMCYMGGSTPEATVLKTIGSVYGLRLIGNQGLANNIDIGTNEVFVQSVDGSGTPLDFEHFLGGKEYSHRTALPTVTATGTTMSGAPKSYYMAGQQDNATSSTVMTDSGASFPTGGTGLDGYWITNVTDGSYGKIQSNTGTTVTVTALTGGTGNNWENNDYYEIFRRYHEAGDRLFNSSPKWGEQPVEWQCVRDGSPGAWGSSKQASYGPYKVTAAATAGDATDTFTVTLTMGNTQNMLIAVEFWLTGINSSWAKGFSKKFTAFTVLSSNVVADADSDEIDGWKLGDTPGDITLGAPTAVGSRDQVLFTFTNGDAADFRGNLQFDVQAYSDGGQGVLDVAVVSNGP